MGRTWGRIKETVGKESRRKKEIDTGRGFYTEMMSLDDLCLCQFGDTYVFEKQWPLPPVQRPGNVELTQDPQQFSYLRI